MTVDISRGELKSFIKEYLKRNFDYSNKRAKKLAGKLVDLIFRKKLFDPNKILEISNEFVDSNEDENDVITDVLHAVAKYISENSKFSKGQIETATNEVPKLKETQEESIVTIESPKHTDYETQTATCTDETPARIGRVVLSQRSWATPTYFPFWVIDDPNIHVEPGILVTVESDDDQDLKVVGIVEEIRAMSDVPDVMSEFYGWGYGNPEQNMSTHRPIIREAKARVVYRSDGRAEPVVRKYPVRFAERDEIIEAYSGGIPEKHRFLLGFTQDAHGNCVPIYADFNYIFGFNGAHVNISGASGLAAKTSYAIFLILSALAYSRKHPEEGIGIVAFNVKERDLLDILKFKERFKNLDEVIKYLGEADLNENIRRSAKLWSATKKEGIDPFELLSEDNVRIFEPGKDFKFGYVDLIELGEGTPDVLRLLFEKEDIDDKFEALLISLVEDERFRNLSFNSLMSKLREEIINSSRQQARQYGNVFIGNVPHHTATVQKFLRRLKVSLEQLSRLISKDEPVCRNKRIPLCDLRPGSLFIINIEPLPDKGKRLVFLSVLKVLNKILEAKKEGKDKVKIWGDDYETKDFPKRICVFVDELNKFVPAGKAYSAIKAPIIDIAARGRSIGLSLIGAQQMATQVDGEVLANTSTQVVGRSHPVELKGGVYDWLGSLKERVMVLKHGEIIVNHAIHNAPVLLRFPIPLHRIP